MARKKKLSPAQLRAKEAVAAYELAKKKRRERDVVERVYVLPPDGQLEEVEDAVEETAAEEVVETDDEETKETD